MLVFLYLHTEQIGNNLQSSKRVKYLRGVALKIRLRSISSKQTYIKRKLLELYQFYYKYYNLFSYLLQKYILLSFTYLKWPKLFILLLGLSQYSFTTLTLIKGLRLLFVSIYSPYGVIYQMLICFISYLRH